MEALRTLLETQPVLTLFLVISLGYALGDISIAGFRLGVGAVLFVGLFIGAFVPKSAPHVLLSTVGLVLFCYGIGIQYGKAFVRGLSSPAAQRQNLIAALGIVGAGMVTVASVHLLHIPVAIAAGIFAGALVNTPTLDSVLAKLGNDLPVVGYGAAYPFGVFFPIFCIYLFLTVFRPKLSPSPRQKINVLELCVGRSAVIGKSLGEVMATLPPDVQVVAVRQEGHNRLPKETLLLAAGDELMIEGKSDSLKIARDLVGEETEIDMFTDRHDLDDSTFYVSNPTIIGRKLGELDLVERWQCAALSVWRGNSVLYPRPGLVLEAGDRVRLLTRPERVEEIRKFFGDSADSTAEVSYLALGSGMALGVLFGLIPFPVPGLGTISFGAAGGTMIVALLLGWLGRYRGLCWTLPPSANLTLRNFGLTLFLAVAGLRSAEKFVSTIRENGFSLLAVGAIVTLTTVLIVLVLGYWLLCFPFDEVAGVIAGVTGNPAILAYASRAVPTNKPELSYSIVFPASTILKIIVVQVVAALLKNG